MAIGPGTPGAPMEAFSDGFPCSLVGTVGVRIDDGDGNTVLARTTASIIEISCVNDVAVYRYDGVFPSDASLSPYTIVWDDGDNLASEEILVGGELVAEPVGPGPCTPWIGVGDITDCCDVDFDSTMIETFETYAESASAVLFAATGGIFTGLCGPVTVRPCRDECACFPAQRLAYASGGSRWIDTGWTWMGQWWANGRSRCGCGCVSEVLLSGYPVQEITEVKIDGDVIDESEYRLDENRYLTRKNGAQWPSCQDLSADDTDPGTFSVSYIYGVTAPPLAQAAAGALACEFHQACSGGECKLPSGAVRIIRQGITIEKLQPLSRMILQGDTGIVAIDSFIAAYGTRGVSRRPSVWSPDGPRYARPVG